MTLRLNTYVLATKVLKDFFFPDESSSYIIGEVDLIGSSVTITRETLAFDCCTHVFLENLLKWHLQADEWIYHGVLHSIFFLAIFIIMKFAFNLFLVLSIAAIYRDITMFYAEIGTIAFLICCYVWSGGAIYFVCELGWILNIVSRW